LKLKNRSSQPDEKVKVHEEHFNSFTEERETPFSLNEPLKQWDKHGADSPREAFQVSI